jgi:hypothetical protein
VAKVKASILGEKDDITQVQADVLITAVPSTLWGPWTSDVDEAICKSSKWGFHLQLVNDKPLRDGQLILATNRGYHGGKFDNVLFIVDDCKQSVYNLVMASLKEAERRKISSISIFNIRTNIQEQRRRAATDRAMAIADFIADQPANLREISIIPDGPEDDRFLHAILC